MGSELSKKNSIRRPEELPLLNYYREHLTCSELHEFVNRGDLYFNIHVKKGLFRRIFDKQLKRIQILDSYGIKEGYRSDKGIICFTDLLHGFIIMGNEQAILECVEKMENELTLEADPLLDQCVKQIALATANSPSLIKAFKKILPIELCEVINTYDPIVIKV